MPNTFSRDRLQPALLDRLVDEDPTNPVEALENRAIGKTQLRQCVLRDLAWLLNTQAALPRDPDARESQPAENSVLNFGIPPLAGASLSGIDLADLENALRQAILDFEPRILPDSLTVRGIPPEEAIDRHNVLSFEIGGRLWAQPYPLELLLKTDLDLETGSVVLRDRIGKGS